MKINLIYRDKDIIICEKPVGILSEENGMPKLLEESGCGQVFCVHRLDRAVGGLMVYAANGTSAAKLSAAVSGREMKKVYLAVIEDKLVEDQGIMRDLLFKDSSKNRSYVVKRMRRGVKEALLEYSTLEKRGGLALLKIELHTGRSHQIRCQLSSRGAPLLGDVKYGSSRKDCPIALWSCALGFAHPRSGEPLSFSSLPKGGVWENFEFITGAKAEGEPSPAAPGQDTGISPVPDVGV